VIPNLNALDSLIAEARKRKARSSSSLPPPIPSVLSPLRAPKYPLANYQLHRPHTLPPPQILSAHLHPHLTHTQSHLNATLQTVQSQNALLATTIQKQREEIAALLGQLEGVVGDIEGAVRELQEEQGGVERLTGEIESLDREVKGSSVAI
jgi:kinetochore protein NNF1